MPRTSEMDLFDYASQAGRKPAAPAPQNPCTPIAAPPPEADRIRKVLAQCIGRDNALTAPAIADSAGLFQDLRLADRGTRVRDLITTWYESLQIHGHVLIATGLGFFHTADPEDLSHYHATLRSRAFRTLERSKRFRICAQAAGFTRLAKTTWS